MNLRLHKFPGFTVGLVAVVLLFSGKGWTRSSDFRSCAANIATNTHPMTVLAPILDYTVTSFDLNWFNTDNSQQSTPLFTLYLSPLLKGSGPLTLSIYIWADTSLGRLGNPPKMVAFDRTTLPLDSSDLGVPLPSSDVFALPFQAGGTKFDQNNPLYELLIEQRQLPQMNLHIEIRLFCGGSPVTEGNTSIGFKNVVYSDTASLRYVHTLQALTPGTDVTNAKPVTIYTLTPFFSVVSDLINNQEFQYPDDEPKMEIFIYELHDGENPQDVLDGVEFAKFPVSNQMPVVYPPDQPQFVPGRTYVWRVRALLRGPEDEYRFSNALQFQIDSRLGGGESSELTGGDFVEAESRGAQVLYGDDYIKRVRSALKIILGENFEALDLTRADKFPAKGQMRINGRPCSLEDLERLAREFQQSRQTVTRVRFQ
jgi:hypothetical protein